MEQKKIIVRIWIPAALVILFVGYFLYSRFNSSSTPEKGNLKVSSIAVLPFVNMSGDSSQNFFSDGLTEGILNSLAHINGLKVSARNSSFNFRGKNIDIKEVGTKLGIQTVLEGSVQVQEGTIRITAQLINVEDGFHFWSQQYDEKLENVFQLQDKIANAIAEKLELILLRNEAHRPNESASSKEEYELYLKARSYWATRSPKDLRNAIGLFEQVIKLNPAYAAAYSGLADCYTALGYGSHMAPKEAFLKAKAAATKAVELDSLIAEPHASLAYYHLYYGWDWEASEQEFRTALALNPNYALAYDWYGYYLTAMERYDEAKTILQKAAELDPLSVAINTDMGFSMFYSTDYDQAIKKLKAAIGMDPKFILAHLWLGRTYQQQKMYADAIKEFKIALSLAPQWPVALAQLGHAYGVSGDKQNARLILKKLDSLSAKKFVTSYGVALVYAGLQDKGKTIAKLNDAVEERSNWLVWLKTDPRWTFIRGEREYAELLAKVGLPR